MKRRDILKMSALAVATAAASGLNWEAWAQESGLAPEQAARSGGITWNKAPCRFCGTGCHVQVGTREGKVVAIAGDQAAEVNRGLLCVKGYHVGLALYGKDRLTTPLLRKNGKLVPISWEQALEVMADRVQLDPQGFAFYGSGQWTIPEGYAAQKFMKGGLANNNIDPNARLCMSSAVTGFLATYGVDEPAGCFDDLDKADVVICWGNNPAEMHPVLFSRIVDRRSKGEEVLLIDIGTRRTRTTAQAQHYLQMKSQGDLAIALGIMHLLVVSESWDKEFVDKHCAFRADSDPPTLPGKAISFQEFRDSLAPYTPEKVHELSGVSTQDLRMLANLFADRKLRITSLWCMGMNQHTQGTAINCLVHGVHLLSGHFGTPGNAPTSLTGQPSACGTVREVGTLAHALPGGLVVTDEEHRRKTEEIWNLSPGRINPEPGLHTVAMFESWSTPKKQKGGEIHTIFVQVTNPRQTLPNVHKLMTPGVKDKDKFLIVSDVYPTATTQVADLVLPAAMWVEKNGMVGNSERRTQQWFRQVKPPGQARDDCWQTIALARRLFERGLGMKDKDGRFLFEMKDASGKSVPVWDWNRYYEINVDEKLFEEYRLFSGFKHKNLAPYQEYVKARGLRWPVIQQPDGSWRETRFRFAEFDDPNVTKGQGIEFYHSTSNDGRAQIWFRPYVPPPEVPDQEYPLWLCTGRVLEHWHSGTLTGRIPQLRQAMPNAYLEMHRDDASALGIGNGNMVEVTSRRGSIKLPVWIDGRGRPPQGTVFVPFFDERLLINFVTLEAHDFYSKQPDYKKCAVKVRRA
ncbi:MAG: molybdopterin-dependent oxidoreductase [Vulcanimicrobiota bacterium]